MFSLRKVYPYAVASTLKVTLPVTEESPTTLRANDLLLGVKAIWNRLAVKLELL
jgi:hypothetical protein